MNSQATTVYKLHIKIKFAAGAFPTLFKKTAAFF